LWVVKYYNKQLFFTKWIFISTVNHDNEPDLYMQHTKLDGTQTTQK
jgi:hypothetical protein